MTSRRKAPGATKRPFERRGDELRDQYEPKRMSINYAPLFRTPQRYTALERVTVQALIERVKRGDWDVTIALTKRHREPEVRVAVTALANESPTNHAIERLLATFGGSEARGAFDRRLHELATSPAIDVEANFCNDAARDAAIIARHVLTIDREALEAAELLARLCDHPCEYNRMWAVWQGATVLRDAGDLRTLALEVVGSAIRSKAATREKSIFAKAIPGLWAVRETKVVMRRSKKLLRDPEESVRLGVVANLMECRHPQSLTPLLVEWVTSERSLRARIAGLSGLAGVVPSALIVLTCREALASDSPSLRYEAVSLAERVEPAMRAKLFAVAVRDEPDPELRAEMERTIRRYRASVEKAERLRPGN